MKTTICLIAIASLLLGCSQIGSQQQKLPSLTELIKTESQQNGRACVRTSDIRSYGTLKNNFFTIKSPRKFYLGRTMPGCFDLDGSFSAAFDGDFSEVCGASFDRVITDNQACGIGELYEFNSRDEALLTYNNARDHLKELKAARKKSADAQ
jgi:hypothetical protein